ncbi:hypothetical protein BWQ96_10355 [Gracilariopsis chorda]|uniref:Uncharacterized protein n=1 Tax=Gracilariopsis chorda TaxID=448386 RepID=A0A2V3ICY8_9FLOR|nr:hypothetical protein BWQ96_10355 [Gracilariopsis chorda]|eukprot:PXF39937.1 hypothetical protein BWQ96_10355 [Gracilariopsis chorda]
MELLKKESTVLDYGFPAADLIMANILGRIQGILCANDSLLEDMQKSEHFFQLDIGEKSLKGGRLKIPPRRQIVMGELLLRRLWNGKYDFIERTDKVLELRRGPMACVTFLEYTHLMEMDSTVQQWYQPIVNDFAALERNLQGPRTFVNVGQASVHAFSSYSPVFLIS